MSGINKHIINVIIKSISSGETELINKEDVRSLALSCAEFDTEDKFFDLCFTARYIKGLLNAGVKASANPETGGTMKIQMDIEIQINNFLNLLSVILENIEEERGIDIAEKYLGNTSEHFQNLIYLISDLSKVKSLINDSK